MRLGWYSQLQPSERRTFWASFGGLALDSMDSTIYALVMPVLITVLGISKAEAGILGSASLIGVGIGGWLAGLIADRVGRVRVLQVTVVWVALATFLAGLCSTFGQFLVVRTLQGIGYGGEAAIGALLVSETVSARLRGRVAASVQSGYAVGYAISVLAMPVIFALLPEHLAWRLFFCIAALPAVVVWGLRRFVDEPAIFLERRRAQADAPARQDPWRIFRGRQLRITAIGTLLATGIMGGAYVLINWLPTYLRMSLGLPVTSTSGYLALNIVGSLLGPVLYGLISDRIGRGRSFLLFLLLQAINVGIYLLVHIDATTTLLMGLLLGACQGGLASGLVPAFSELYPTAIRGSGAGFCASVGRGCGALMPALVGIAAARMELGTAMGLCALASYALGIVAALLLPDAAGIDMQALDDAADDAAR